MISEVLVSGVQYVAPISEPAKRVLDHRVPCLLLLASSSRKHVQIVQF